MQKSKQRSNNPRVLQTFGLSVRKHTARERRHFFGVNCHQAMAAEAFAPTDEEILEQQEAIKQAEIESHPRVSSAVPTSELFGAHEENPTFLRKLKSLAKTHSHVRRTRPDGSCFYRAFLAGLAEYFIAHHVNSPAATGSAGAAGASTGSGEAQALYTALLSSVESSCEKLLDLGHSEYTVPDFKDAMVDFLLALPAWSHDALMSFLNTDDATWVIYYTRLLASLYICSNPEEFTPVVLGLHPECAAKDDILKAYVSAHVEPATVEADQPAVAALVAQTGVRLEIAYLDSRGAAQQGAAAAAGSGNGPVSCGGPDKSDTPTFHQFSPPSAASGRPHFSLLYRPGHYDIVYAAGSAPPDAGSSTVGSAAASS